MGPKSFWLLMLGALLLPGAVSSAQGVQQRPSSTRSPHGSLNLPCENCHTFTSWSPLRSVPEFDHNKTSYPLRGLHASVDCKQCHASLVFTNVGTKCADCHADIHRRQLGAQCESCHTVKGWRASLTSIRDHQNRFPLVGAHAAVDCDACHRGAAVSQFKGLSTDCVACHKQNFIQTRSPNHVAASLPVTCQQCHRMDSWQGATFNHGAFTGFALTGMHATLDCAVCHVNGSYQGASANCISCHAKEFNATQNPNHVQAGFPADCAICHSTVNWTGVHFDHAAFTGFALAGAHTTLACAQCHANDRYAGTPSDCASCHLADYQKTTNPNHAAAGFPQDCSICHSSASWSGAHFDHNAFAKFALTGAHATTACVQCHPNGRFAGTPRDCASCHLPAYQQTTNPSHVAAAFPQDCAVCHTTTSWSGAQFDHSAFANYPLTGAHATVACATCHPNNRYAGTPRDCASCHLPAYQQTTNPNHVAAGFPQDCSLCHSTTSWAGASFDHSRTLFPLTGAHVPVSCTTCHVNGVYSGLSTACVSCHLTNYNNTANPAHQAAGIPQQCEVCHSTAAWTPASFDHSKTGFVLTGAHVTTPCASCHVGGKYAGTPTDCYSCHKSQYQTVTNPNHIAAGFPTNCALCHTTTTWMGATFTHNAFPIYSGAHQGKWTTCNDCHVNPSNFTVFSCTNCHAHDKTTMDDKHTEVRNYVYNSANCYSCHPTGRAG